MGDNPYFKRTTRKYKETDLEELDKKQQFFMIKHDGTHIDLIVSKDNEVSMLTREGNDVAHLVPYLVKRIKELALIDSAYACEAVHLDAPPKKTWEMSRSVLGSKAYRPELPQISLVVYDCYKYMGRDITWVKFPMRFAHIPTELRPKIFKTTPLTTLSDAYSLLVTNQRNEGLIVIDNDAEEFNKTFAKLKPDLDIDCIVTAMYPGKKGTKLEGKLGAFQCALMRPDGTLQDIGKVPTMTEEERDKWTFRMNNPETSDAGGDEPIYIIQVKASEVTKNGKLRFGSYVRERTDKKSHECGIDQLD